MPPDNNVESDIGKQAEEFGRDSVVTPPVPTMQDVQVFIQGLRLFEVEPYESNYINIYHKTCGEDLEKIRGHANIYSLIQTCLKHLDECDGIR